MPALDLRDVFRASDASTMPGPVVGVQLARPDIVLAVGQTEQLNVYLVLADGSTRAPGPGDPIVWSSSDSAVATVTPLGLVRGSQRGVATITVSYEVTGPRATLEVRVRALHTLDALQVTPAIAVAPVGWEQRYAVHGHYVDQTVADLANQVTWTSTAPAVATVSTTGVARCIAAGTTTVRARATREGFDSSTAQLRCSTAPVSAVALDVVRATLHAGSPEALALRAVATLADGARVDASAYAAWASSAPGSASVSAAGATPGVVSPGGTPGEARIAATLDGVASPVALVRVVPQAPVRELAIEPPQPITPAGEDLHLTATATHSDGRTVDVTGRAQWSSAQPSTATVGASSALVHGVAAGTTAITAALDAAASGGAQVRGETFIQVLGATAVELELAPVEARVAPGAEVAFVALARYTDDLLTATTVRFPTGELSAYFVSADTGVATILPTGRAYALGPGHTGVHVERSSDVPLHADATLTVTDASVRAISVFPQDATAPIGRLVPLRALATFSDGTTEDVTERVSWTIADAQHATLSSRGEFVGLDAGAPVLVSAALQGASGTTTVTPAIDALASIELVAGEPGPLTVSATRTLRAVGVFASGARMDLTDDPDLAFASDAPTLAAVSNAQGSRGALRAIAPGRAEVTATLRDPSGVVASAPWSALVLPRGDTRVELAPVDPLYAGFSRALRALVFDASGASVDRTADPLLVWRASDASLARVSNAPDSRGVVRALAAGTLDVFATVVAGTPGRATLTVRDAALLSLRITPGAFALRPGAQGPRFVVTGHFADGGTADVTDDVAWTSDDPARVGVWQGAVFAVPRSTPAAGLTVRAHHGDVEASAAVDVLGP